ncbi:MAG: aspartate aminotransferase family protein [Deltaproteobacteria bacterium]|jgi:predicted acetylornithine/succinylornithine family transaminase|nr:aspartate aminotransferase family protein [Deltaproteobacteria bacterium]MCL5880668.1 aspartate aminotransferase family protein [Deltaproteobacteria bacterium]MDA8305179.1 aspartate aminotransferase family protein [Deltaproteobacteria bacterium]
MFTKADIKELTNKYIMNTYGRFDLALVKGDGTILFDENGKSYIDFASGIAVNNLGYNNKAINSAIIEQLSKLIHVSNYFYTEPQALLAEKLCMNSFADKVFFCNSGAESVEGAIKLARIFANKFSKRGYKIITMQNSFHGRTFGALSATGQEKYHNGFEPLLDGFTYVKFNDLTEIEALVKNPEYCAVIVEPVQGEGGVNIADRDYLKKLRELTFKNNILLIFDEVQVGLGRTGKLFAYMNFDVEPDIMTLAKPLAGGLPIGAVLAKDEVARAFEPGNHASTFGGGPLVLSAANAFFDEITKGGFLDDVLKKGDYIGIKLNDLKNKFPKLIKEIRTIGLISAVEFYDLKAKDIAAKLIEKGFLTTAVQDRVLRLTPPLIIKKDEIDSLIGNAAEVLNNSVTK